MADTKVTELGANTSPLGSDLLYIVDDPGGSAASQKITISNLIKAINLDGWVPADETWTYASADDPTFTFTVSGVDLTTKYYAGMRLKLTQTSVKYFIITKVEFSTNTTVTIYGGTDYDLANAAITSPYYSTAKAPAGFPLSHEKWDVETLSTASAGKTSPVTGTWYGNTGLSATGPNIVIPIGAWTVVYFANIYCVHTGQTYSDVKVTLSTAANSESDADFTNWQYIEHANGIRLCQAASKSKNLTLTAKATYYMNIMAPNGATDILIRGDYGKTIIRAVCAYL